MLVIALLNFRNVLLIMLFGLGLMTILRANKYHFAAASSTKRLVCHLTLIYNLTTDTMQ